MKAFLSHSSSDKERYVGIVAELLAKENVVYDELTFEAGERTLNEIIRGLDESGVFCLFISNQALDSRWVQQEVDGALIRLKNGSLKSIYPIMIESSVAPNDPRIPKWLSENYNLRLVTKPSVAARRIHQKLRQASWAKHPKLSERANVFVGRNKQIEEFELRFDEYTQSKPVLSIIGGAPSIGRRTLIKNALRKMGLAGQGTEYPTLPFDRHASIEDFIIRLLDLGASSQSYTDLNLVERTLDDKVAIAVELLKELASFKERIILIDDGCLVTFERTLATWFVSIINHTDLTGIPLMFVASRWSLNPSAARDLSATVFSCSLGELDTSERIRLFGRLLDIEDVKLIKSDFDTFADLLHGFPDEVFFAVDLIRRYGTRGALYRSNEIVEFNSEKAVMLLAPFEDDEATLNVIRLLAQSEVFSVDFLCQIFNENLLAPIISKLLSEHVCELIGIEGEFVRLVDSVRDYVKRNNLSLAPELREAVNIAIKDDIRRGNWDSYDSSRVAFLVKKALASGEILEPRFMIPSHILRAIKDLYYDRTNLKRAVLLADTLLAKERNLDPQLIQDARYYLCLALARLRDRRVLNEAQHIRGDEHSFILGYYYRLVGRQRDAIEHLRKVINGPFVGVRAKRELVEVYLQMEQFDEARELAQKNYEENRTNQFHIHAYFRSLVQGSNPEQHVDLLRTLCAELQAVGSDKAREMAMIGQALIAARCQHDTHAINIIDDAITIFSKTTYPVLAKFDIGLSFRNVSAMQAALTQLEMMASKGSALSARTLAMHRAYLAAVQGNLTKAQTLGNDAVTNFTDDARARFSERLAALASGTSQKEGMGR